MAGGLMYTFDQGQFTAVEIATQLGLRPDNVRRWLREGIDTTEGMRARHLQGLQKQRDPKKFKGAKTPWRNRAL